MSGSLVAALVAAVVLLALWWTWLVASRLDRLHRKVAASRAALDTQLVRRASCAAELAASGVLDPVSSVLTAEAAWGALSAGGHGSAELRAALPDLAEIGDLAELAPAHRSRTDTPWADREIAESELTRTLCTALEDPEEVAAAREQPTADELLTSLAGAWYRVQLARRFHNEAVAQAQRVRRKPLVRALRLAGHAPRPTMLEIDDSWPAGLPRPGAA